mmetsp:Transcript_50468/g.141892  ORF Transcript_50468/g.141892 Transcript_50468/m.141892 type:complete len:222 (-) Transcript_50468:161-826(-)
MSSSFWRPGFHSRRAGRASRASHVWRASTLCPAPHPPTCKSTSPPCSGEAEQQSNMCANTAAMAGSVLPTRVGPTPCRKRDNRRDRAATTSRGDALASLVLLAPSRKTSATICAYGGWPGHGIENRGASTAGAPCKSWRRARVGLTPSCGSRPRIPRHRLRSPPGPWRSSGGGRRVRLRSPRAAPVRMARPTARCRTISASRSRSPSASTTRCPAAQGGWC